MHVANDYLSQCLTYLERWRESGREEICLHFDDFTADLSTVFDTLSSLPKVKKLTFGSGDPYEGLIHYRESHKDSALRRIKNLDFLRGLHGLEQLDLRGCPAIETFAALRHLPNLKVLTLSECPALHQEQALACAESLLWVKIVDLEAPDLRCLSGMRQLGGLVLRSCHNITSLRELGRVRTMLVLQMIGCARLSSLSGIEDNQALSDLEIHSCNSLRDISPLAACTKLEKLRFDDCENLTNVTALHCLSNLTELLIKKARRVRDLSFLSAMPLLTELRIRQCHGVADLTPISKLPALNTLHLEECRLINDFSALAGSPIEEFCAEGCWSLTDLSALTQMPRLKRLYLYGVPELLSAEAAESLQARLDEFKPPTAKTNELWKDSRHAFPLIRNGLDRASPSRGISVHIGLEGVVIGGRKLCRSTTRDELLALFGAPSRKGPSVADETGPNSPVDWIWDHLGILVQFGKEGGACTGIGFVLSFGCLDPQKELGPPPYERYPASPFKGSITAYGQSLAWNSPGNFGHFEPLILRGELAVSHSHHGTFKRVWDYYNLTTQLGLYRECSSGDLGVVTLVFNSGNLPQGATLANDEYLIGEFRECSITTRRLFVGGKSWRLCDAADLKREVVTVPQKRSAHEKKVVIRVRESNGTEVEAFADDMPTGDSQRQVEINFVDNARFDAAREVFLIAKAEYGAVSSSFVIPSPSPGEAARISGNREQEAQTNRNNRLVICADCDAHMSPSANACPKCGNTNTRNQEPKKIRQHIFCYFPAVLQIALAILSAWLLNKLMTNSDEPLLPIAILGAAIIISAKALWQILLLRNQLVQHSPTTFIYSQGVFDQRFKVLNRNQIEMDIFRPFWGTVFGYGTLIVKTSNTELRFNGLDLSDENLDDLLK